MTPEEIREYLMACDVGCMREKVFDNVVAAVHKLVNERTINVPSANG